MKKKSAAKKAAPKQAKPEVYQHHIVIGMKLDGETIVLVVTQPGVSNAARSEIRVPREFGQLLCPGMLLKTTLTIEGLYKREK